MDHISIYGILNVTPDSFSDGGSYIDADAAASHALKMIEEGADVIDIGGMSTRPGFTDVSVDEEISRVVPVIELIKSKTPSAVISVDTFRAETARASLEAGAGIINDITGLMGDSDMASVVKSYGAGVVIMRDGFGDPDENWEVTLQRSVDRAKTAGIADSVIMIDPGVGFTKTREQDIQLIKAIPSMIRRWGYPVLLGVSRKRIAAEFYVTDTPASERLGSSIGLALSGIDLGASILRVHDVKQTRAAVNAYLRITDDGQHKS